MLLQLVTSQLIGNVLGGLGILSGVGGLFGRRKATKQRNEFTDIAEERAGTVTEATQRATNLAEENASSVRMTGQDLAEDNLKAQGAASVGQAKSAAVSGDQVLQSVNDINTTQMGAYNDLQAQADKNYQQRQAVLTSQLNLMGKYQDATERDYLSLGLGQAGAIDDRATNGLNNMFEGVSGLGRMQSANDTPIGDQSSTFGLLGLGLGNRWYSPNK